MILTKFHENRATTIEILLIANFWKRALSSCWDFRKIGFLGANLPIIISEIETNNMWEKAKQKEKR